MNDVWKMKVDTVGISPGFTWETYANKSFY